MLDSDLEIMKKAAFNKADICNNHLGKYFIRAIVAGFFIVVATMLSNDSSSFVKNISAVWKTYKFNIFLNCNNSRCFYRKTGNAQIPLSSKYIKD